MLHRRRFLDLGLSAVTVGTICHSHPGLGDEPLAHAAESLVDWVHRTRGQWDGLAYQRMLGAANEYKEGDEIVGVSASSPDQRELARTLLANTRLSQIDEHSPYPDQLFQFSSSAIEPTQHSKTAEWTLGQLKHFLLTSPEEDIKNLMPGLSSDVIACVVRLMNNGELIRVGANVFNPLPGTKLGARGYMGARIQPNSPTDNLDDIRWQIFNAFAFAVGDVLIGTNPVSSDPDSVLAVEQAIQELLNVFELTDTLPHCVLAHIDVQAEAERRTPNSTALWFQSIAGNDAANKTFDITVDKMITHAQSRYGKYSLYFETGQGADFTNGHGQDMDMVLLESRKYGFARALSKTVADSHRDAGIRFEPWVHVNDVAGFIGPEVFRSREQLVRCCLEDIVMGKLHGLMIGLDVCSTLHMDVTLDDLGWCIDQIMPANPGYLMALPTRIDPMLGYLTTGYHDHIRVREKFGYKVDDRMWQFFQRLGVIDANGAPTENFGRPEWVYLQYRRARKDTRSQAEIFEEADKRIAEVRSRGLFISQGFDGKPSTPKAPLSDQVHRIYADAKECIWKELAGDFESRLPNSLGLETCSKNRTDYILHPESGERLSNRSIEQIGALGSTHGDRFDAQIVISDGLNAMAIMQGSQLSDLLTALRSELALMNVRLAPEHILIRSGRVRAGYRVGEKLFANRAGSKALLHIIGERPGSGHNTLSIYVTKTDGESWGTPNRIDHNITQVVSGIASTALLPSLAAQEISKLLGRA